MQTNRQPDPIAFLTSLRDALRTPEGRQVARELVRDLRALVEEPEVNDGDAYARNLVARAFARSAKKRK